MIVETVTVYGASEPGEIGRPSTCRSVWHARSVSCPGQAADFATAVRYGENSTVDVVVTYAELAQS